MWAFFIVVGNPGADPLARLQTVFERVLEDAFAFWGPPQPFDHADVDPATSFVHRNLHLRVVQNIDEISAGTGCLGPH